MSEKTLKPTPRRLREARKKGEVARSKEVDSLVCFIVLWISLRLGGGFLWNRLARILDHAALAPVALADGQPWQVQLQGMGLDALSVIAPIAGVTVALLTLAGFMQTRGMLSFVPLTPKFDRLNPGQGLRNLFTLRQLFELGKMLLKATLLLSMLAWFLSAALALVVKAFYAPATEAVQMAAVLVWRLMGWAAAIYAACAAVDYGHQFYEFMKKQKMSLEELRREIRENEGNPLIKRERRSIARQTIFKQAANFAASASVVVVNPTHIAVALFYERGTTLLPKVVAKGADAEALEIRAHAVRKGVPVLEDKPLARRLFREVPLNHYINEELIDAVAAVFRWVSLVEESRRASVELPVAEAESNAAHRVDQPGEVGPVDLAAQPSDMHVNDVIERGGALHVFPDLVR
jgi:type III secretion protein U